MIFLSLFLMTFYISQGLFIKKQPDPFNQLIDNLLSNCSDLETVIFYGDFRDEVVISAVRNQRKIQTLTGRIQNITVSAMDLLVIFLNSEEGWNRSLAGEFLDINTVFIVSEELYLDQAKMIFEDFWNSSESSNVMVCSKSEDGKAIDILTHNPYNNYAPRPFWSHFGSDKTFFGRYLPGETKNICSNLLFDRTKYLENYPIQNFRYAPDSWMEKYKSNYLISQNHSNPLTIKLPSQYYWLDNLMRSLRVSINLTFHQSVSESTRMSLLGEETHAKYVDIKSQPFFLDTSLLSFYDISSSFRFSTDVILTHHRGLKTPLEKMFHFYGWLMIVATLIIISVTFVVIYHFNNRDLSFSIFECLRLIVNVAIYSRMESTKTRIFFSMIFLYFLVIQATFSGHLAAFLTKPEYRKNVENLEDLKDPRYKVIYASPAAKNYITDETLLAKTVFEEYSCNFDTITNPGAACVGSFSDVKFLLSQYNLYYTEKPLVTRFSAFLLRKNWRLKNRANQVIMRTVDSALHLKKFRPTGSKVEKVLKLRKDMFHSDYYRPVELADLLFIFVLLGIGLLMGVLAFAGELAVQKWKIHQKQIRRRWRASKRAIKVARRMLVFKILRWFRKIGAQNSSQRK